MKNLFLFPLSVFLFSCAAGADDPGCVRNNCMGTCLGKDEAGFARSHVCRPDYVCYQNVDCTILDNGKCGWKVTPQLQACLAEKSPAIYTPSPTTSPAPTAAPSPTR